MKKLLIPALILGAIVLLLRRKKAGSSTDPMAQALGKATSSHPADAASVAGHLVAPPRGAMLVV